MTTTVTLPNGSMVTTTGTVTVATDGTVTVRDEAEPMNTEVTATEDAPEVEGPTEDELRERFLALEDEADANRARDDPAYLTYVEATVELDNQPYNTAELVEGCTPDTWALNLVSDDGYRSWTVSRCTANLLRTRLGHSTDLEVLSMRDGEPVPDHTPARSPVVSCTDGEDGVRYVHEDGSVTTTNAYRRVVMVATTAQQGP